MSKKLPKLAPLPFAVLEEIVRRGKASVSDLVGHPFPPDDRPLDAVVLRAIFCNLWGKDALMVVSPTTPFTYSATEKGKVTVAAGRVDHDEQKVAIRKLRQRFGEVKTVVDKGHANRRVVVIPVAEDGELIHDEARVVYSSGTVRRAIDVDLDALLEGAGA